GIASVHPPGDRGATRVRGVAPEGAAQGRAARREAPGEAARGGAPCSSFRELEGDSAPLDRAGDGEGGPPRRGHRTAGLGPLLTAAGDPVSILLELEAIAEAQALILREVGGLDRVGQLPPAGEVVHRLPVHLQGRLGRGALGSPRRLPLVAGCLLVVAGAALLPHDAGDPLLLRPPALRFPESLLTGS